MFPTKLHRGRRRIVYAGIAVVAICFSFAYGVGVGFYGWPPFLALKKVQDTVVDKWARRVSDGEEALIRSALSDPVIDGDQIHPPIASLGDIQQANRSMALPVEQFFHAYDSLQVTGAERFVLNNGTTRLLKVMYELGGSHYDAYAYAGTASRSNPSAALVIPGTGLNQSSAIYEHDRSNYQFGIMEALEPFAEPFVLIKPNEDCLAFYKGKGKLNQGFFINWLLNAGASYSAYYIVNSLAITKYLKSEYESVVVAGLSQGGYATLLNSLQSQPDVAIVASGFSVLDARDMAAGHDQIIIPGLREGMGADKVRSRIRALSTSFLFTYGKNEGGAYRIEASEKLTCEYLSRLENVECRVHEAGHVFPIEAIREFLRRKLG